MNPTIYLKDVYCDKCNKETVVETIESPNPLEAPKKSMAEYKGFSGSGLMNAVYRLTTHILTCKSCGNTRTFTS